jgi:hypothetical protein
VNRENVAHREIVPRRELVSAVTVATRERD